MAKGRNLWRVCDICGGVSNGPDRVKDLEGYAWDFCLICAESLLRFFVSRAASRELEEEALIRQKAAEEK